MTAALLTLSKADYFNPNAAVELHKNLQFFARKGRMGIKDMFLTPSIASCSWRSSR